MDDPYIWPPTLRLEAIAREIADEWGLELGPRFALSRFAYAAPLGEHVLKIAPSEDDQADLEPDALRFWDGAGAVRILRHDPSRRALLLERVEPGYDASRVDEGEGIGALLDVGRQLWKPVQDPRFRSAHAAVERSLQTLGAAHPFGDVARSIFRSLTPSEQVLLHGDLHHHNLLRGPNGWLAVDPKPLVGEREFDVTAFLWNPLGQRPTLERTEARIAAFAAAGLDEARLRAWAIVRGTVWDLPFDPSDAASSRAFAVVRQLLER